MQPTRVIVCDDTPHIRMLLRVEMGFDPDIEVVGEAENGAQVIDLAAETQPDVIVLDLAMPVMDGLTALPELLRVAPESKVIVLTSYDEASTGREALALGASAFLDKARGVSDISDVIHLHSD